MRKTIIGTGLAAVAAAVAGGAASRDGVQNWYSTIRKPGFVPPNAVFPIAWTALYTDIAATSAAVINRFRDDGDDAKARAYIGALGANLVLNASWRPVVLIWFAVPPMPTPSWGPYWRPTRCGAVSRR